MTPTHHPSHHPEETTLLAHAAGHLNRAARIVVAAHLQFCPHCQETIRLCEAIGGALLDALPPAEMQPDSLEQALARLGAPALPRRAATPWHLAAGLPCPAPLNGFGPHRWRPILPGISRIQLLPRKSAEGSLYLLRIAPGKRMPRHSHGARELTCVLSGAYTDSLGHFVPGDLAENNTAHHHQPVSTPDADCICLVATEAPLRFEGVIARMMQPMVGV